ncbi:long-chain-fatty-acid--CoA ligase [Fictibacillus terranigra]|uniref:Long-chain-fatty-acid--CoA ligase n=1 Tax=Fictibacillus terranigra TaxID=3058424 RepID=A0ABT8E1T8_9BACL|nr:long-chain-fatty-acid--CoA ligase [Fictibacillus sp. CENA-BCM004]MDN4071863.1 long-chain-fatty-acid--CoA ligase [Fictibacillus sp. CENA-BCM004]
MNVPMLLPQFLDRAVKLYGKKTAIIGEKHSYTYYEVNQRVNQLSRGLQEAGIEKGDRVGYLAPNTSEMYEGFYGVLQLGAVMVPLNTRLTPEDYLYILNHSGTKVLFVHHELVNQIEPVRNQLTAVEEIIVHGLEQDKDGLIAYEKWLDQFDTAAVDRPEMDENDLATLLYTSGTTGKPKGVMLSHRSNFLHALTSMHHLRVSDRDVLLHVLPMFHVNGWGSPFYYTANGATQVFLNKVMPAEIFRKMKEHGVSVMHMAPTVLNSLLQYAANEEEAVKTAQELRIVIAGSAPPPAFVKRVEEELNWEFIQVYGMTETSPLITTSMIRDTQAHLPNEEKYRLKAKAGYEFIGSEVKVVNENGDEVAHDSREIGEIVVRSNTVMEGYWNNPEETSHAIRNGWYHTGDMAVVDEEGNIEIADRKKDIIISGGENISSIEVEGVLYDHPAVLEAAVIAVPHEKWGETPQAVVVLREGHEASEDELITFARSRLAHFKAPTIIVFADELPKTGSGKIQKVHLRKEYWKDKGRLVN